jgi:hypothetical protein
MKHLFKFSFLLIFLCYNCSNQTNNAVEISENWEFKNNVDYEVIFYEKAILL